METDSLAEPVIASSPEVSPDSAENQIERVWGKAPYPLVPASLRAVAGEMLAPDSWQAEGGAPLFGGAIRP